MTPLNPEGLLGHCQLDGSKMGVERTFYGFAKSRFCEVEIDRSRYATKCKATSMIVLAKIGNVCNSSRPSIRSSPGRERFI